MFKDELNIAFENVKPSTELLDRVSAMMSEEVSRKKPPLQMRFVKYVGIAAAVALAAGGTMLFFAGQNNGVKTSEGTASAAPAAFSSDPETDGLTSGKSFAADVQAQEAVAAEAADADDVAEDYAAAEEATAEEAEPEPAAAMAATTSAASVEEYVMPVSDADADMSFAECVEGEKTFMDADNSIYTDGAADADAGGDEAADATPMMIAEAAPVAPADGEQENEAAGASAADVMKDDAECADEEEYDEECAEPTEDYAPVEPQADSLRLPDDGDSELPLEKIVTLDYRYFINPCIEAFDFIPEELTNMIDDNEFTAWCDSFGEGVPDSIEDYANLYTFIKRFEISRETLEKAVGDLLTEEQINVLFNGTVAEVTAEFAADTSIVRGDKIYSSRWIMLHTPEDYEAAGITPEELLAHGY